MDYKCPAGNDAAFFCINQRCSSPSAVCSQQTFCDECLDKHTSNCSFRTWEQLVEIIRQNHNQVKMEVAILNRIDTFLKNIVTAVNNKYQSFQNWKQSRTREPTHDEIVAKIKSERRLTGKTINRLKSKSVRLPPYLLWLLPIVLFVYASVDLRRLSPHEPYDYVQTCASPDIIHAFKEKPDQNVPTMQQSVTQAQQGRNTIDSIIVNNADNLNKIFRPLKAKSFRLLYRASEHNFCIRVFHHLCDGIPNVMSVLKNQYGQIIGGYSPIAFQSGLGFENTPDLTGQTFLFSLSSNIKFPILDSQKHQAVNNNEDAGPTYGAGFDLIINDQANKNKYSYSKFPNSFYSPFEDNPEVSKFKFVGTVMSDYFKIDEWEVFEVEFQT